MTPAHTDSWAPTPELLAAYFDGEFEGRDELVPMRRQIEDWLAGNPEALEEFTQSRRLKQLWLETTPPDPGQAVWWKALDEMETRRDAGDKRKEPQRRPWKRAAAALAACVLFGVYLVHSARTPEETPFPVAGAGDVDILHVEGADIHTIIVGELPVKGPLILAASGDVVITSMKPAVPDNMVPEVHSGGSGAPFIWAQAEPGDD